MGSVLFGSDARIAQELPANRLLVILSVLFFLFFFFHGIMSPDSVSQSNLFCLSFKASVNQIFFF